MFVLDSDVETTEPDEKILTFDVPDDALERAAAVRTSRAHDRILHSLVSLRLAPLMGGTMTTCN
jgi:hypothetical protein